jgi:hypothetical protein
MSKGWAIFLFIAAGLIAWSGQARGHGGHDENIRVISDHRAIQIRFVVEATELLWFDTNRNGVLSRQEFDSQAVAIALYVDRCLNARSSGGASVAPQRSDQPISGYADLSPTDPVERIRFIRVYSNEAAPNELDFACFPGSHGERQVMVIGGREVSPLALRADQSRLAIR